jgi:ribonucleoside-diphosphate reductase alpha chain
MPNRDMIYLADDLDATVDRILSDKELSGLGLNRTRIRQALRSFKGDEIAASVFLKKYALRDERGRALETTLEEAKDRWARAVAGAEKSGREEWEKRFRRLYDHFLPAGRQMFALGNNNVKKATFTNCYVTKITDDSIEGIYGAAQSIAKTFSYGGGIGLDVGELRPRGAKISNSALYSTGSVSFMELFSLTSGLIGQSFRRGALMITIPVNHPDIEEFIEIKHGNRDKVKYANISVKLTDEFMRAVEEDRDFTLSFETKHERIEKTVRAGELWRKIVQSARDSAEPGLMFWDQAVRMSPSDVYPNMRIHSSNPCGEQLMEAGSACVLGSLLLHTFVRNPFTPEAEFDFGLFGDMVRGGVRHLDNIVTLNMGKHALPEQEEAARRGRRIGLGITGLADMLASLGLKYDSEEALAFVETVMAVKRNAEYGASMNLAAERGSFEVFDAERHYERGFPSTLPDELKALGHVQGQRNVAISTVAPSGSLSIIAQCSSGIEPIFALRYKRYVELGDERKEFEVRHQGIARFIAATGSSDFPDCWVTAHEIPHEARIRMQAVLQRYVDASISSTVNLPKNVDTETVASIYMDAWKAGLKGVTVYREGSREGILVTDDDFRHEDAAGMPVIDTVVHMVRAEGGDKFYIPVSYRNADLRRPYQVFIMNYKAGENDRLVKLGNDLVRMVRAAGVDEGRIEKYLSRSSSSLSKVTRFISLALKADLLEECVSILDRHAFAGTLASELHGIFAASLAIGRLLCKECGSHNVRHEEGCKRCLDCGWTGCG